MKTTKFHLGLKRPFARPLARTQRCFPICAALLSLISGTASAADPLDDVFAFDIPANTRLEDALISWGTAARVTVMINTPTVDNQQTRHNIKGTWTARQALIEILSNSGLSYTEKDGRVRVIAANPMVRSALKSDDILGAQGTPPPSATDSTSDTPTASDQEAIRRDNGLPEVVVTAEKREERLQDVPVPVATVDARSLSEANQVRIQDYYTQIPSLSLSAGTQSAQNLTVRGLSASVLLDDVPMAGAIPDIDPGDLSRIEVLRGPQGTLYGYSGLGGLVKYVTVDPSTTEMGGHVEGGVNDVHNGYDLGYYFRGSANIPLTQDLAIRVSGFTRQDPGYVNNPFLNINGINRDDAHGGRITALWHPTDTISLRLSALYQSINGGNQDTDLYDGLTMRPLGDLQQSYVAGVLGYERKTQAYSAVLKARLGVFDLTSVTGYNVNTVHDYTDNTPAFGAGALLAFPEAAGPPPGALPGTPVTVGTPLFTIQGSKNITQEIRLSASFWDHLDVLLGGFYRHDPNPLLIYVPAENPTTGVSSGLFATFELPTPYTEGAAFADLTYHFTENFDVQVGGRISRIQQAFFNTVTGPYTGIFGLGPSPSVTPTTYASSNPFTYLVTPRLKLSPDTMLYLRFASAFLPGGTNAPGPQVPPQFGPETSKNYEIGLKSDFFDHALSIDGSLYYIDFIGLQNEFYDSTTKESYTANAGEAKSRGAELSLLLRPARGLTVSTWFVISDAHLTSIPEGVIAAETQNGSPPSTNVGDQLPNSSRFSANGSVNEEFNLFADVTGSVNATASYIGEREGPFAVPRQIYPAYAKIDLHAAVNYGSLTFSLFANNIADRRGIISGDNQGLIPQSRYIIQPRTIGLSVAKTF